jgi:5-formyltetrahydrofolate cyclo-ligase
LLAARKARPPDQIEAARAAIRTLVLGRAAREGWGTVAAFVPMRTEPGSVELLDALIARGVRVLVPQVLADRDLNWCVWGSTSALGVAAIGECDAVLAPALAVSRSGARLGRGGGSYDRALVRRRAGVPAIAVLYADEVVPELPTQPWDAPVDEAVTPEGFVALTSH